VNTLTRLRHAQTRIFKAQRRLVLAQALFWPTVVLASVGAATAVVMRLRSRDTAGVPSPIDGLPHL
jgi:hypothetical protein